MNQELELNGDSYVDQVDVGAEMHYLTRGVEAGIHIAPNCGESVLVTISGQAMYEQDLKEAIKFLKAVRRSLKAAAK